MVRVQFRIEGMQSQSQPHLLEAANVRIRHLKRRRQISHEDCEDASVFRVQGSLAGIGIQIEVAVGIKHEDYPECPPLSAMKLSLCL